MRLRKSSPTEDHEWLKQAWNLVNDKDTKECVYCGGYHFRECPRVRRVKFYPPDGEGHKHVKEVEYWADGQWPEDEVIFVDRLPYLEGEDTAT